MKTDKYPAAALDEMAILAHRRAMLKRARGIVRNEADAEDAVQEALERAWRSRGRFLAGSDPAPWLLRITTNVSIDMLRRRLHDRAEPAEPQGQTTPEERAVQRETARSIGRALQALAPAHRNAFVLHAVQGYSSREISTQERLPYHTVRTHLFRARRGLRRALAGVES